MKICLFSDTHTQHQDVQIPEADVLIFAGDGEFRNKIETLAFIEWFDSIPIKYKYAICGNHDFYGEKRNSEMVDMFAGVATYLENELVTLPNGMTMWGSPITPRFMDWAFMSDPSTIHLYWEMIPKVDILLTHGPAKGILDAGGRWMEHLGCPALAKAIERIKPKYHVFGHIHEGYGMEVVKGTTYINCSVLNEHYELVNSPIVIEV